MLAEAQGEVEAAAAEQSSSEADSGPTLGKVITTAAVLLAAGEGSRHIGMQHKLLRLLDGKPLILWAVESACEAGFDQVYVVTGAVDLLDILPAEVTIVENHHWQRGQGSSLLAGVHAAENDGHGAVVVGLGDMPFVTPQDWQTVAETYGSLVTATYHQKRSPPVKLEAEVWPLLPLFDTDEGARSLMRRRPELVVEAACSGRPDDFDTEADFRRARA